MLAEHSIKTLQDKNSGAALIGVAVQVLLQYADSLLRQKSEEKLKKGGSPIFHQDSKTIVADHQQLKSAICAVAISPTHACQIVRQSSYYLPPGISTYTDRF